MVKNGLSNVQHYASITPSQLRQILLHSLVPGFISPRPISGFEHVIKSFANQSLWLSLDYNRDSSWILDGMLAQSLVIIHDGSYMKEALPNISLAATMIYCTIAKTQCKCTWAKQSISAGSYCRKILGRVMTQLILNAAASKCHDPIPLVVVDCDNNGVVSHGNKPLHPFPTNQSQATILHVFKNLVAAQPFHVWYKYVQSHANDTKRWQDCMLKKQFNIKVDNPIKKTLEAVHSTGKCIESAFPNKQIWISMEGKKVMGSLRTKLEKFWGWSTIKKVFPQKRDCLICSF
jgi:hypothetical protein